MKKMIGILLTFCFSIVSVNAIYGGETISFPFEKCQDLLVNITPCEVGEWVAENCVEESICNFVCDCTDDYVLNLTVAENSVGTFEITLTNYWYEEEVEIRIGGGTGGRILTTPITCNFNCQTSCVDDDNSPSCFRRVSHGTDGCLSGIICCESIEKECPIITTTTTTSTTTTTIMPIEDEVFEWNWLMILGIGLVLSVIIIIKKMSK